MRMLVAVGAVPILVVFSGLNPSFWGWGSLIIAGAVMWSFTGFARRVVAATGHRQPAQSQRPVSGDVVMEPNALALPERRSAVLNPGRVSGSRSRAEAQALDDADDDQPSLEQDLYNLQQNGMLKTDKPGNVYVLTNPDLPNSVKIGQTVYEPERRAASVTHDYRHAGLVDRPFQVAFAVHSDASQGLERAVHAILKARNVKAAVANNKRELFAIEVDDAIRVVKAAAELQVH